MSEIGKVTQDSDRADKITVEFSALSERELVSKTMTCLQAAVSLAETEKAVDETTVAVTRKEFFDTDMFLSEYGSFKYSYTYPDYYKNVSYVGEEKPYGTEIGYGKVVVTKGNTVRFCYERGFRFDRVDIFTDYSDIFGRVTRKVRYISRVDQATAFHETIKSLLSEDLTDGVTLNIYDFDGNRYYELSKTSCIMSNIEAFAEEYTDGYVDISDGFLPLGRSNVSETVKLGNSKLTVMPKECTLSVKSGALGSVSFEDGRETEVLSDKTVRCTVAPRDELEYSYRRINLLKLMLDAALLLAFFVAVMLGVKAIKMKCGRKKAENGVLNAEYTADVNGKTEDVAEITEALPVAQTKYCELCGAEMSPTDRFCERCGNEVKK